MVPIILTLILVLLLVFSIFFVIRRRKKAGITGFKSALTPICFYLIAVVNILAYWFNFLGLVNWGMTVVLLILGAYFTRFMPIADK
ncbi:hypothetical protein [Mesobacillus foraminis]|uniref:Putative secreted protein with PEP-CTERM sorting signal n=1 Tax=Mesobacillus foraminis TaxID=279826 RepID=A0A4R2BE75_9BACI|nr:hypothetical protein [Mesobacillus foraminis]TCN24134.1 putative secreted protein with PEP-CTERM sorting signal [Mesobacillus foraminis]